MIGEVPFFLEVTAGMPFTRGQNLIPAEQVVGWIRTDQGLPPVGHRDPNEADHKIADYVAELIPDGACLQWLDGDQDNQNVQMMPVDWTNDPRVVGQEPNFISINATTEVDLMGQAASETIAGRYWSSSGGQADFARGAMYSPGGKAFLVQHSATSKGRSRIRVQLIPGSVVTTIKNTVDRVVTEYGVASLRGRSIADRARELIAIAHPDHRDDLRAEAQKTGILP